MTNKVVAYEIYAINVYGSDVEIKYTLEGALKCAKEWSTLTKNDIVVVKVEKTRQTIFRNGEEVA